jgi:hypoxanthine phosphoribosyltransferase
MRTPIDRVLLDRQTIAERIGELGAQIADDFTATVGAQVGDAGPASPDPTAELTIVPLLTGSVIFVADLMRELPLMMRIRLMSASSYPGKATTSQGVMIEDHRHESLAGRHVLIVDDILDSGRTLTAVREEVNRHGPASVKVCVLLRKRIPSAMAVAADYVGFDIADQFVVGYGLDYDGYYRNLPEVVTLKPEAMG